MRVRLQHGERSSSSSTPIVVSLPIHSGLFPKPAAHPACAAGRSPRIAAMPVSSPRSAGKVANTLAAWSRIFFGDFGIFVQRDVFFAAGGFAAIPFCEDIEFCRSARRFGRMVQIDRFIQSSPRRFERVGRTKLTAVYFLAPVLNLAGIRPLFLKRYIVD